MGNLTKVIDARGGVTSQVFDKDGNLVSETNTDGATTSYTYDKAGRVTSITDPVGAVTLAEYDGDGNIVKITQADGHVITYTYDANDQLISYVDAEGYTHGFTYDGNGNIVSSTDGNGNTTRYTYDGLDRVIGRTDEEGGVASRSYDADGRLIKTVNEEGAVTSYAYDACGRVVSMTDALGNSTAYTYDNMDRVLTVTDARGGVTAYTYTDRGDIATRTDAEGYFVSYSYDGNRNCVKMTTVDGDTLYTYDELDRLTSVTTPDGKTETFTYNGEGQITSSTDKGGHTTKYVLDANGRIIESIDARGNSAKFTYDLMGNLSSTSLHRVDYQDGVDEWELTTYEYDGRGLVTRTVDALGNVTTYGYDGNENLVSRTDPDGYVTAYSYNKLDMVTKINYNGGKQVSYAYNAVGDLVEMNDWTGKTSFEVDLLDRITKTTDIKGNKVQYTYDETGNQTSMSYPDSTSVSYTYDLLGQMKTVTETDGRTTSYTYDGMGRLTRMVYPHGWAEDYHYDAIGQLTSVEDTDPSGKDMKQQKHVYRYDDCGNMVYEYMRGNGTGEATVENTFTYDSLHRIVSTHEDYGNDNRSYSYDSLGNLTYETLQGNKSVDYKLNNLNQISSSSEDGWKTRTEFEYDKRGNLVKETYGKNKNLNTTAQYVYDETNKMVKGINAAGESSVYVYNGLGALVENVWTIAKNAYGYHDVDAGNYTPLGDISTGSETNNGHGNGNSSGNTVGNNGNGNVKNPSTVVKQFVVDYTSETYEPLTEREINGLDYRYVYGNDRLSVNVTGVETSSGNIVENGNQIRLYYHMDHLGTADYLTSPVSLKVTSWTHYNEWGEITHNAVLKCGMRELDMVKRYATHDYDAVLNMFYAKARFYDADNRRFASVDPVKGYVSDPASLVQYPYVKDNPLVYIDPDGNELVAALIVTAAVLAVPILADLTVKAAKSLSKGIEEIMKPAASTPKVTTPNYSIPVVGSNSGGYIPPKQVAASAGAIAAVTAASAIAKGTGASSSPNVSTTKPSTGSSLNVSTTTPGTGASSGISLVPQQKPLVESMPIPEQNDLPTGSPPLYYDDFKLPNVFDEPISEPEKPHIADLPTYDGPNPTVFPFPLEQETYFPPVVCAKGDSGYKVPPGGGGISDAIQVGDTRVTFGHGGRHLDGTGLTVDQINIILAYDVVNKNLPKESGDEFGIDINGIHFKYRAYVLQDGTIKIGTYYIPKKGV